VFWVEGFEEEEISFSFELIITRFDFFKQRETDLNNYFDSIIKSNPFDIIGVFVLREYKIKIMFSETL